MITQFDKGLELEKLINKLVDQYLKEYDDLTRRIAKEVNPTERAELIQDLRGVATTIEDLLNELPNREPEIYIVDGKVQ
jgi:hypothetical protein